MKGALFFVMDFRQFNDLLSKRLDFIGRAFACPELALDFFTHFAFDVFFVNPVDDDEAFDMFHNDLGDFF